MPNNIWTFLISIGLFCFNAIPIGCFKTKSIQENGLLPPHSLVKTIKEYKYNDQSPSDIPDSTHQSLKYSVRTLISQ